MKTPSLPAQVIPEEPPTAPMPDPDDELVRRRGRRSAAQQRQSGYASTIMSDVSGPQTLGG